MVTSGTWAIPVISDLSRHDCLDCIHVGWEEEVRSLENRGRECREKNVGRPEILTQCHSIHMPFWGGLKFSIPGYFWVGKSGIFWVV